MPGEASQQDPQKMHIFVKPWNCELVKIDANPKDTIAEVAVSIS